MLGASGQQSLLNNKDIISNTVKYAMKEDPFIVPMKFKREVPLNRNIFELNEQQPKNYKKKTEKVETSDSMILDPLQMSVAIIKLLLVEKVITFFSTFSILISVYEAYYANEEESKSDLILFHMAITAVLLVASVFSSIFQMENNNSRKMGSKHFYVVEIAKFLILLLSPNIWTIQYNNLFHLALGLRIIFPLIYYIRSSIYFDPRAARIVNIYGIKPQLTFKFAWKVILNDMSVSHVLMIYISVVIFYSHCLFLIEDGTPFIDCFEIVIVTLPTVGYGEYDVPKLSSRLVILLVLVTGVALNAFVTLTMLKKFQMSTSEYNSYILMQKLNMVEEIESLSSEFIIRKINRKNNKQKFKEKQKDDEFKEKYKECKARYRALNPLDSVYQFNYFNNSLSRLKNKIHQVSNMISVLLARLISHHKLKKAALKHMDEEFDKKD